MVMGEPLAPLAWAVTAFVFAPSVMLPQMCNVLPGTQLLDTLIPRLVSCRPYASAQSVPFAEPEAFCAKYISFALALEATSNNPQAANDPTKILLIKRPVTAPNPLSLR